MKRDTEDSIKFADLVAVRKEEMGHMMPGLQTTVEWDGMSAVVHSPAVMERRLYGNK